METEYKYNQFAVYEPTSGRRIKLREGEICLITAGKPNAWKRFWLRVLIGWRYFDLESKDKDGNQKRELKRQQKDGGMARGYP